MPLAIGSIEFINGINTSLSAAKNYATSISERAGGAQVDLIYNQTHTLGIDLIECLFGTKGFHTPPIEHLKNRWTHFIATHRPDEKILVVAHSGGAIHVLNALLSSPEHVFQRIIAIGIAPGAIIPRELCHNSYA